MNQNFIQNAVRGVMPQAIETGLFVSLATFQEPSGDLDALGVPDGLYSDVAGFVDIACTAPPYNFSDSSMAATETREMPQITATEWLHVLLDSYYPGIVAGWRGDGTGAWRVVIDGTAFDIGGAESASQRQMTRVKARLSTI